MGITYPQTTTVEIAVFFLSSIARSFSTSDADLSPNYKPLYLMWVTYPPGLVYLYRLVCKNKTMLLHDGFTAFPHIHNTYYYYNNILINIKV
jgi:hypothetical protein